MARNHQVKRRWRSALFGGLSCALVGLALDYYPHLGNWLAHLSYDLAVMFRSGPAPPEVVIIYMDEESFSKLHQAPQNWDRALHADLIGWLTHDQAKLVVLDVVLTDPGSVESNQKLAQAIRAPGKVVLAADLPSAERPDIRVDTALPPSLDFEKAAWGISGVDAGSFIVRRFYSGDERNPSLPWMAASLVNATATQTGKEEDTERWLNFYGPPGTFASVSYCEATNQPSGYFSNKVVFIGSQRSAFYSRDRPDEFPTPHMLFFYGRMAGVEIAATAFLNLLRHDWLSRLAQPQELLMIAMAGLLFGFSFPLLRPGVAWLLAGVSIFALAWSAIAFTWRTGVWGAWTIPAGAQIPLAVLWSWLAYTKRLRSEKESLQQELTKNVEQMARAATTSASTAATGLPAIPDHTLLKRVGAGGYGEVWLARNAVGGFHAVKIVYRRDFTSDEPYEREFKGIQNFMPISRSHPGLVHILHVGRKDDAGFFFCIMEAGDDEVAGHEIHPDTYSPKTLAKVLERRGALSVEECLRLGADLAAALEHLHQKRLIHRDIKPANIIYVEGAPKLADIGLVTTMKRPADNQVTQVGTAGFVAPEGPGMAAADIYSLGKVLYEACMGQDRRRFPELPTAVYDAADFGQRSQLNEIIVKACATLPDERYQSAAELRADLLKLGGMKRGDGVME